MATRNGKVANLPNDIREQLNLRLLEGETGKELVAWLNALPAVQSVLASEFHGSAISEVNLTHWRQGGYLQWLTERECFDSARALADGDCDLADTGLSAERLLNVLTVRFGQLLMRWDLSPDEGVSEGAAFTAMARKARILQGISRSVLAIHRIQSQSPREKRETARSSVASGTRPKESAGSNPPAQAPVPQLRTVAGDRTEPTRRGEREGALRQAQSPERAEGPAKRVETAGGLHGDSRANPQSAKSIPVSALRSPVSVKPDPDLCEILEAV